LILGPAFSALDEPRSFEIDEMQIFNTFV